MRFNTALATVIVTSFCSAPAAAQNSDATAAINGAGLDAMRIGVLGGGGIAWVSTNENQFDMRYRAGWSAGAYGAMPLSERFGLRAEALYSRKGVRIDLPLADAGQVITGIYQSQYIEVPLLVHVDLAPDWDRVRPFVIGGPSPAYLISRTYRVSDSSVPGADKTDETQRFDVGLLLGGGAALATSFGIFELNARATFGLLDISDKTAENLEALDLQGNNNTRSILVIAGFSVPLAKLPGVN